MSNEKSVMIEAALILREMTIKMGYTRLGYDLYERALNSAGLLEGLVIDNERTEIS
jgi:hypothetical protein